MGSDCYDGVCRDGLADETGKESRLRAQLGRRAQGTALSTSV